jgi:hypothetical protein
VGTAGVERGNGSGGGVGIWEGCCRATQCAADAQYGFDAQLVRRLRRLLELQLGRLLVYEEQTRDAIMQ